MKRRALLRLIVSLLLIAAFVIGATIVESSGSLAPQAWYWAQRQLPLLWIVDAFALAALVPVCGVWDAQNRLHRRTEETARSRDEHQAQLERMIHHAERADQTNAEQAETIAALQNTLAQLSAKLETMQTDGQARQQALEAEAQRLAEQAFASVNGQVEANTRQMEAVNLAMQYQRAEIKQLRQGMRVIQRHHDVFHVAQLTPDEMAAIEGDEPLENRRLIADADANNRARIEAQSEAIDPIKSIEGVNGVDGAEPLLLGAGANEPGFFAPTMNGQATYVSVPTAFTVAAPDDNALEDNAPEEASHLEAASTNLHVSDEEYRWLTGADAAPSPDSTLADNAVFSNILSDNTLSDNMPHNIGTHDGAMSQDALPGSAAGEAAPPLAAPPVSQEASTPANAVRRWKLRL